MKRTICTILLAVIVLGAAVYGCGHSAPASLSGSSGDRSEEEYSGETFYYAADNVRVKNMMDGIEMSVSAENEEAYRSMILEAV